MADSTLDKTDLYSTLGADPELGELVSLFVEEMPERIATMESSYQQSNRDELARAAHQIKGAAGSYGFHQLTDYAARLEKSVRGNLCEQEILESLMELVAVCRKIRAGSAADAARAVS